MADFSGITNAGTTNKYLAKFVAKDLGVSEEEVYASRHENDAIRRWYEMIRKHDPSILVRESLKNGNVTSGINFYEEAKAVKDEGLVNLMVWIENNRVPPDTTMKFGSEMCDIIIQNNGGRGI